MPVSYPRLLAVLSHQLPKQSKSFGLFSGGSAAADIKQSGTKARETEDGREKSRSTDSDSSSDDKDGDKSSTTSGSKKGDKSATDEISADVDGNLRQQAAG